MSGVTSTLVKECASRRIKPGYSTVDVERVLVRKPGITSVTEERKSNDEKRCLLAKLFNLDYLYINRVYLQSSVKADDGKEYKALLSRQGILAVESSPLPRGNRVYSKFKYLDVDLPQEDSYRNRASSIQYVLHKIVESKSPFIPKGVLKAINRLSCIGLTTNKSNFKSLLSYIHRKIPTSVSSQTALRPKCRDYPVLSKQRRSLAFNGKQYTGPSWHWRKPRKEVREPWI